MTERDQVSLTSPQPVGAFGLPAGFLLVPDGDPTTAAARADLVAGRLPERWPPELRVHELVHGDRSEEALALLGDPRDAVEVYHRWLLDPESADPQRVRAGLPAAVRPLVDIVAYSIGAGPVPADPGPEVSDEVAALVLAAQATARLERGDPAGAPELLVAAAERAAPSAPVLAAVLLANAGTLRHEAGDPSGARSMLARAAEALAATDLADVRAELLHRLGSIAQERATRDPGDPAVLLKEAMGHYLDALALVTEESDPHRWAALNMDLATAHLAQPMTQASDQLRLGVATQALRACRRVWTPDNAPGPWSTATLNLANALVYTPSTHQGDNLVEAVELYEEVLASGVRDRDPVGRARLLTNQGNALAHLGIFDQATAKLVEARYLFEDLGDHDGVLTVRGILDEIAKAQVTDPDDELAELARQAEQMARVPQTEGPRTAGMSVTITPGGSTAGDQALPPPKPRVTVLAPGQAHPEVPPDEGVPS